MEKKIRLIKNNQNRKDSDLEKMDEFYQFLQGALPDGMSIGRGHKPVLSEKKAMSIIWYLQEHLSVFPDHIERCSNCGSLYDSYKEGLYVEKKGKFYCGGCDHLYPYNSME